MSQIEKVNFPELLVHRLEIFLDELDQLNLIQTAARLASTIDTLKTEVTEVFPDTDLDPGSAELIRASERD